MGSFKAKLKPIKIFVGIIVLILIAVVLGYYLTHREGENLPITPLENKHLENDSTQHLDREEMPEKMSAKPEIEKDGSVKIVTEFIKLNAKNPATFEFLEWSEVSTESGYWKVRCRYKGVSAFNAEVTTNSWFYMQNNKVVYTKIISKI